MKRGSPQIPSIFSNNVIHGSNEHVGAAGAGGCFSGAGVHSGWIRLGGDRSCAESQARDGMSDARGPLRPVPRDLWVRSPQLVRLFLLS